MKHFVFLIFIIFSLNTQAKSDCNHTTNSFKCVKYLKNYDGDTVSFNIPNTHPIIGRKISIRIEGVDTPELKTKNNCEKQAARTAKKLIANILKRSQRIDLENVKRGKYFRIVADVIADGRNLKQILLDQNLAMAYNGGTKTKTNWCSANRTTASPN